MQTVFYEAASRGFAKNDWLTTRYSFSFAGYYDPERMGFGALRVVNDDSIAPGAGFGRHPHDNMEIITIPLSGALRHEDSMGNGATIEAGEVQVMSAGSGVEHAEYNASTTEVLQLLQIWILSSVHDGAPRYNQKRFDPQDYENTLLSVVSPYGEKDTLGIFQEARIFLGRFTAEQEFDFSFRAPGQGAFFFVIEGEAIVATTRLAARDALGVWETETCHVTALPGAFLLVIQVPMMQ